MLQGERATANIVFTSAVQPVQRVVRVYGTRQALEVDFDGRFVRTWRPTRLPGPFARIELAASAFRQGARALARSVGRFVRRDLHYFASMARLFGEFYAAVRAGRPSPVPPREILRVTAIMDDIFRACQDGEPADLDPAAEPAVAPTGGRR
jgi:predicted dehydrogenase